MKTYKSESNIRPDELQIEKSFVYINYNVVEEEVKDPTTEELSTKYIYDTSHLTLVSMNAKTTTDL